MMCRSSRHDWLSHVNVPTDQPELPVYPLQTSLNIGTRVAVTRVAVTTVVLIVRRRNQGVPQRLTAGPFNVGEGHHNHDVCDSHCLGRGSLTPM